MEVAVVNIAVGTKVNLNTKRMPRHALRQFKEVMGDRTKDLPVLKAMGHQFVVGTHEKNVTVLRAHLAEN